MGSIFLALDYGSEGWVLEEKESPEVALQAVKDGESYGQEWKILRELDIEVTED